MVKIRKVKKKNWAKRQSCSSNPLIRSHRDAARRGFRHESQSGSGFTVEALTKHNENRDDVDLVLDDAETTGRSMATVSISGLTDCSNPTFSGVLKRFWQSPGANHQEICAVLAAVTEVIRKNGGNETETEYFAALMTALETTEDDKSLAAIAFLLTLVINRVPQSVLQVKFSAICQVLLNILAAKVDSQSTALLKSRSDGPEPATQAPATETPCTNNNTVHKHVFPSFNVWILLTRISTIHMWVLDFLGGYQI